MCGGGGSNLPEERESQRALAEAARFSLDRYGRDFIPIENMMIGEATNYFNEDSFARNYGNPIGRATTQTAALYEQGLNDMQQTGFQRGYDPGFGAFQAESDSLRAAQARGMGLAGASAGVASTDRGYDQLSNVVAMGQGLASQAVQGQVDSAQMGVDRASAQAGQDFMRSSSLQNLAGTATGMAAGYGLNQRTA